MRTFIALAAILTLAPAAPPRHRIRVEAEDAHLRGTVVSTIRRGYSGRGYVTGFEQRGDRMLLILQAEGGLYEVRIRYSSPQGPKGFGLTVNDTTYSGLFPGTEEGFATHRAGRVELRPGRNTIAIERGWGYFDIDYLEFIPRDASPKPRRPPKRLANPNATPRARAVMSYLVEVYGERTLSGQYGTRQAEHVRQVTGKTPAILGGDLIDYSPSRLEHGADPGQHTEEMIEAARQGHIITMLWHWNAPTDLLDTTYQDERGRAVNAQWYRGFYTEATTFDLAEALADPESQRYQLLLRDMDAIAAQLRKFADADVPVLWRPLHEAKGEWFWWGAKGPQPYRELYRLLFRRLTDHHGLNNLIWVYDSFDPEWYPGDEYVDIVGVDAYPEDRSDPLSGEWESLIGHFDGRKMLGVTEIGGVPDVAKMHRHGAPWLCFVTWTGRLGPQSMSDQELIARYTNPLVITRDDLPAELSLR